MYVKRRFLRAGAVLAVALAAGHLVQTMRHGGATASLNSVTTEPEITLSENTSSAPAMLPASASLTSGGTAAIGLVDVTDLTSIAAPMPERDGLDCKANLSLIAEPDAMIVVGLSAPCNRGERVVLRHAGLNFTARTSVEGALMLRLPALEADGVVTVYLAASEVVIGSVAVPDMAAVRRFGLQWTNDDVFGLRINEDSRIFVASGNATDDRGGKKVIALGDRSVEEPMFAEIYTYPTTPVSDLELLVEVSITPEVCGQDVFAESIFADGGIVTISPLTVPIPQCGAEGDILVLKNLAPNMKIAAAN